MAIVTRQYLLNHKTVEARVDLVSINDTYYATSETSSEQDLF